MGQTFVRDRSKGGRSLRSQKNVMKCPACPIDISDFLQNLQVCCLHAKFAVSDILKSWDLLSRIVEYNGQILQCAFYNHILAFMCDRLIGSSGM